MATNNPSNFDEELALSTTGEPTDQLAPEEDDDFEDGNEEDDDLDADDSLSDFDSEPMDDDNDLDDDEVKRLFPGEDSYSNDDEDDEEPYEGIRHKNDDDEGLVDDNMTGMPVIPSPS